MKYYYSTQSHTYLYRNPNKKYNTIEWLLHSKYNMEPCWCQDNFHFYTPIRPIRISDLGQFLEYPTYIPFIKEILEDLAND